MPLDVETGGVESLTRGSQRESYGLEKEVLVGKRGTRKPISWKFRKVMSTHRRRVHVEYIR